jgi:iron complex outermembrane receptor protein
MKVFSILEQVPKLFQALWFFLYCKLLGRIFTHPLCGQSPWLRGFRGVLEVPFLAVPTILSLSLLLSVVPKVSYAIENNQESALEKKRAVLDRLKKLSLKELSEVRFYNPEATSAARKTQKLLETASALFVISQEDIRRAGITSIPEALRLVPGVQVARVYANRWAISARGLNGLASSKLLVMIDGRTVYDTKDAAVQWDVQGLLIEDIDRIEVIRGPGASLWGANAVNGIINIITKKAEKTQGNLVTTLLGTGEEQAVVGLRHGGSMKNGHYRVYGKFYKHDNFVDGGGQDQQDNWLIRRGGFRSDWNLTKRDSLTVQGDIYNGFTKQTLFLPLDVPRIDNHYTYVNGFNLLARWQRVFTNGDMILQSYYDWIERDQTAFLNQKRGTYDLDFQHRWRRNDWQEFIWGLGFRYVHDDFDLHSAIVTFDPTKRQDRTLSGFVQAEFVLLSKSSPSPLFQRGERPSGSLSQGKETPSFPLFQREKRPSGSLLQREENQSFPLLQRGETQSTPLSQRGAGGDLLRLTLGSKFEHNEYMGFEYQPTARLLWTPHDKHSAWAAVSRAVRTPSRYDEDSENHVRLGDLRFVVSGNRDFQSEVLTSYELGYRLTPSDHFLLDTALFYNEYEKLRTNEQIGFEPFPLPPTLRARWDNQMTGEVYGLEMAAHWQVSKDWRVIATYNYTDVQLHMLPTSRSVVGETEEGDTPHHQATLRSLLSLPHHLEFDTALYYVDNVPNQNTAHYTRFDVRLGWKARSNLDLSLGARNLFDNQHPEFGIGLSGNVELPDEVRRAFYLQLDYRF